MTFLVSLSALAHGSYLLGHLEIDHQNLSSKEIRRQAQRKVADMLVEAGFERDKIGLQVTDYTSLEIGIFQVHVVPIKEFNGAAASTLAALLR
jgi:hypothetical protein